MSAWASWLLNGFQIMHFMPFYAQNYAQNYALIMQNYAFVIMLYAQLCKKTLLIRAAAIVVALNEANFP